MGGQQQPFWQRQLECWSARIGIRKMWARGRSTESVSETMCMPLADAGVTVRDVAAF